MLIRSSRLEEGVTARFVDGKIVATHVENVDAVARANQEARKEPRNNWSKDRTFRHIARVPVMTYYAILRRYPDIRAVLPQDRKKAWHRVLQDPEFSWVGTGGSI